MKRSVFAAILMFSLPAYASEPSSGIDLSQVITDPQGKPYQDCTVFEKKDPNKCESYIDVTVGYLLLHALDATKSDTQGSIIEFKLMEAIAHGKSVSPDGDETKKLVDSLWGLRSTVQSRGGSVPLFEIGEAVRMIDPASLK